MATPTLNVPAQPAAAPWIDPPVRGKKLATKRAERLARQAEHWGRLLLQAEFEGPAAVAAVAFDRLRASMSRLPDHVRDQAFEAAAMALDRIRETHAE